MLAAIDTAQVEELARQLRAAGTDAIGIHTDVTRQEQVDALIARTLAHAGRLDALFNCAGRSTRGVGSRPHPSSFRRCGS